jgi:transposase
MRERALEALRKGFTKKEVNEMFGLGNNTLKGWEDLERETGSLENRPLGRKPRKIDLDELSKYCEENPLATHVEAGTYFGCSERVIRYAKKILGITRKATTTYYVERDEEERAEFAETINNLPDDVEIFYADESGFEEDYSRTHGYSPKGERVYGEVHGTHFGRTSIVGAINMSNEFMAGFAFKGNMNSDLFEGWLESVFVPSLKNPEKSVLIIDNATHHPKSRVHSIADDYGFKVMFLPKYSPDLNPIEKFWANIKNWLRLHMREYFSFHEGLARAFECR